MSEYQLPFGLDPFSLLEILLFWSGVFSGDTQKNGGLIQRLPLNFEDELGEETSIDLP